MSFWEQLEEFEERHKIEPWVVPLIIGTYKACQGLTNDTNDLAKMYGHVQVCERCKDELARLIEHQKEWIE
jgi:hypothetical protein